MRTNFNGVYGEISSMPGCSQIGISHGVFLPKALRGAGIAKAANATRTAFMRDELGYDYALCTVDQTNEPQNAIMRKRGWIILDTFVSSRTGHVVHLYGKDIK